MEGRVTRRTTKSLERVKHEREGTGDDGGQRRWATTVGDEGGRRQWVTKSLERIKHERGTGDQEDDEEPRTR